MELADASLRLLFNGLNRKNASDQISDALTIDCRRYTQINHPVSDRQRLVNRSKGQNAVFAIITNYTHFTEYLRGVLSEIYQHKPMLVVDKYVEHSNGGTTNHLFRRRTAAMPRP